MIIEQIYTGCLAHAAYYIESNGQAAIIDPLRDTEAYVARAAQSGAQIKYVLETHFHADFVSGHLDLAHKTGAQIVYGPGAVADFEMYSAADGEILNLGDLQIKVLHTPGHTMESSCFLLMDAQGREHALFTGDTLFLGDVGRPDLAVKTDLSREDLARHLYDSLHQKILPLGDDLILYPGHGAGSACGKNLSKETVGTLGAQRSTNYALQPMDRETFVLQVTAGLIDPPQYFPLNARLNKVGYGSIDAVRAQGTQALDAHTFEALASEHRALVIDTRPGAQFYASHIPGSINISLEGQFANWVGSLVTDIQQALLFVAEPGRELEVIDRLARIGYDHILGYLNQGLDAWQAAGKDVMGLQSIRAADLEAQSIDPAQILDIRAENEYKSEHLLQVANYPLPRINQWSKDLDLEQIYYIHCAGGYRSRIGASILQARGFKVVDIQGGFKALQEESNLARSEFVCPSKL